MTTEVTTVNSPATSKINWTAGIAFIAALAAFFGLDISQETQDLVAKFIALGLPPLVMFFRTFMTSKKLYGG